MRAHLEVMIVCMLACGVVSAQQPADAPNAAEALLQSAKSSLADGKYQDAEAAFRKLAEMEPSNPRGMMGVVAVYLAQKKDDEAIALLQAESKKNPTRPEYHFNIGEVAQRQAAPAIGEELLTLETCQ